MYNVSNPVVREFRIFVLWKLVDDYVSVKEHTLIVKNYLNPQYRDLISAVQEILPYIKKDQYTLYCRYKGTELYQINDYLTMLTGFRIMEAHDSRLLYLIRKDIGKWPSARKDLMEEPGDPEIIFGACPDERIFTDIHRGRTEHKVYPEEEEIEGKSKKGAKGAKSGGRRQSAARRQSAKRRQSSSRRKSGARRQSSNRRKSSARRQSAKGRRQSKK